MKTTAGPTLALLLLPALLGSAGCTVTAPPPDPASAADTADAEPPPVPPMVLRLEEELAADPDHGPALYVLARYLGRTGDTERAVELLERLRDTGWDYALEHHDFEALADDPRFRAVETALAEREPRVGDAREEFTVGQQGLLSEGMAWDEESGRFFVGAAEVRRVLVVTPDGAVEARWPVADEDRLLAPLGMDVDPRNRRLWVASAAGDHLVGIQNLPGRPRIWALSRLGDDGPIRAEILMSRDDRVSNATTGAYVPSRGAFFYMANPFGDNEPVRMLSLPFDP
jgi:hypothetical protein